MRVSGIIATIICFAGIVTFTLLLVSGTIGTVSYISLLMLLTFACIVIPLLDRLKTLDVKNLKLTLDKIESVKRDIYAKESDLRKASTLLAELIAANAAVTGIWGDGESKKYGDALVKSKIMLLSKQLNLTEAELASIFKYERALADVNAASKEEHDRRWKEFVELLKRESEK